jgi:acyl-coenzyme A synthetase/AMP-(fatty) acid ligase
MDLFKWFVQRVNEKNIRDKVFLVEASGKSIFTYGQFLEKIAEIPSDLVSVNNKPVLIFFDYSIQSLLTIFSKIRDGRQLFFLNPKKFRFGDVIRLSCGSSLIPDASGEYVSLGLADQMPPGTCWFASSGTGQEPVYWPHTVETLTWNISDYCFSLGLDQSNRVWSAFPPFSISGWKSLFFAANCGGSVVWEPYPSGIEFLNFLNLVNVSEASSLAFPPIYAELLVGFGNKIQGFFPKRVQRILCGGDYLHPKTIENFKLRYRKGMGILYGLTETAGPVAYVPEDEWSPGCIGRLFSGKYRVEQWAGGGVLSLSGGFLSPAINEAWFTTSDVVTASSNGMLFYEGRLGDRLVWQGQRLHLQALENMLLGHDAIVAARFFLDSEISTSGTSLDDKVSVEVVLKNAADRPTEKQLMQLLPEDLPKIAFHFVEKISRTDAGKIRRVSR